MHTSTAKRVRRSVPKFPVELSPLEIVQLEKLPPELYCVRDHYLEGICEICGCTICRDLLIQRGGTA